MKRRYRRVFSKSFLRIALPVTLLLVLVVASGTGAQVSASSAALSTGAVDLSQCGGYGQPPMPPPYHPPGWYWPWNWNFGWNWHWGWGWNWHWHW